MAAAQDPDNVCRLEAGELAAHDGRVDLQPCGDLVAGDGDAIASVAIQGLLEGLGGIVAGVETGLGQAAVNRARAAGLSE